MFFIVAGVMFISGVLLFRSALKILATTRKTYNGGRGFIGIFLILMSPCMAVGGIIA